MNARRLRIALAGAAFAAAALFIGGCQTEDPPPAETFLRLKLNDSLTRYDQVLVQILDRNDTSVLATLWNMKPLKSPATDIPGYNLKNLGGRQSFIVKVMGFKARGQLALQTLIYYDAGVHSVLHDPVPKLKPLNWLEGLSPSVSALDPPFNANISNYTVTMPLDVNSLTFNITAATPNVDLRVDGAPMVSGTTSKIFQVGATPDSILITVTDTATDAAQTRSYRVRLVPTPPPELYLSLLKPSYGEFTYPFKSEVTLYVFYMDPAKDTVSFLATAIDSKLTVTIDDQAIFPGKKSQIFTVPQGSTYTVNVGVHRGSDLGYYQITLDHTKK